MTSLPFQISINDLLRLTSERAVDLFRKLLWAEASTVGVAKYLIDVPQCINVPDGGIDASIENVSPTRDDLIPIGTSGFQIKNGDLSPGECKTEVHAGNDLSRELKPEIKELLDRGGSYVLVLYADITARKHKHRETAIKEELTSLGYPQARVLIYTANMLEGFINNHPALVVTLKPDLQQCLPLSAWGKRLSFPKYFVPDDYREQLIKNIRMDILEATEKCPVIRIYGLSGIGKTRLVFEALNIDVIRHSVIYFDSGESLFYSTLYNALAVNNDLSATIVVDECSPEQHSRIVDAYRGHSSRLRVITLSHEQSAYPPPTNLYIVNRLDGSKIETIINNEAPAILHEVRSRISKFADGFPRIASILIESYMKSSGSAEEFFLVNDRNLMNRLIAPGYREGEEYFKLTKKVLSGLSLFEKIGFSPPVNAECEWLTSYLGMSSEDFREIIKIQRDRGIVQGNYYLYVSPFMLRVFLLKEWWEIQGFTPKSFNDFIDKMPDNIRHGLFRRFIEGIKHISAAEEGRAFVRSVFEPGGIFEGEELLQTELGSSFFLALVEADPKPPLKYLSRTIGAWSRERLLAFKNGRREVVWALEKAAIWAENFEEAALLLLKLGEAENESYGNNASGIFKGLFHTIVPSTAAPFRRRMDFLIKALETHSPEARWLVFEAFSKLLETEGVRTLSSSEVGINKVPELRPPTWGDVFSAFREVWNYLVQLLPSLSPEEKAIVLSILFDHARGLSVIPHLDGIVLNTFMELSDKDFIDKKKLISTVTSILHFEKKNLSEDDYKRWESIRELLVGTSFDSLLRRYVGMNLTEDSVDFDEEGNPSGVSQDKLKELAIEAVATPQLLLNELNWLMSTDAERAHQFGYNVGLNDSDWSLLSSLIERQKGIRENRSFALLGGYLQSTFERSPDKWNQALTALSSDPELSSAVIELTWRSGMTDEASKRISWLINQGVNPPITLRLFEYGGVINNLSEDVLKEWVNMLISSGQPECIDTAITFLDYFYVRSKNQQLRMPKNLTLKALTHPAHLTKRRRGQLVDYHWTTLGNHILKQSPDTALPLAAFFLEHFGEDETLFDSHYSKMHEVLNNCLKINPKDIWQTIIQYLGPPIDTRSFHIKHWLQGGKYHADPRGALSYVPIEDIWAWVDGDIENRAWYIASFVPKQLFIEDNRVCLAREVLVRYGDRKEVRNSFSANYSTESWKGSASQHYLAKKKYLIELSNKETNGNVLRWINDYIRGLDSDIERERIAEEIAGF